jgi:hypothetical protein
MRTNLEPFLAWSAAQGINTPLKLVEENGYRFMALPLVSDSEAFFDQARESEQLDLLNVPLGACLRGDTLQEVADKLSYEKSLGGNSKYAPWIDVLPPLADFQDMPRFWVDERRQFLQQFDGGQLEARMALDQSGLNQAKDPWALACVDSRANFLPGSVYSLTAIIDMFNHDCTVKTSARVENDHVLSLAVSSKSLLALNGSEEIATPDFWTDPIGSLFGGVTKGKVRKTDKRSREVFISYGDINNLETLCNYAFVARNECNTETFQVRMLGQQPLTFLVEKDGSIDHVINEMNVLKLRLNLATTAELESLQPGGQLGMISKRNEVEVYALIAGELEEACYQSKSGTKEAEERQDDLIASYLRERKMCLEMALKQMQEKYPEVFGL